MSCPAVAYPYCLPYYIYSFNKIRVQGRPPRDLGGGEGQGKPWARTAAKGKWHMVGRSGANLILGVKMERAPGFKRLSPLT